MSDRFFGSETAVLFPKVLRRTAAKLAGNLPPLINYLPHFEGNLKSTMRKSKEFHDKALGKSLAWLWLKGSRLAKSEERNRNAWRGGFGLSDSSAD
jgi:hypothetical protein